MQLYQSCYRKQPCETLNFEVEGDLTTSDFIKCHIPIMYFMHTSYMYIHKYIGCIELKFEIIRMEKLMKSMKDSQYALS